MWTKVTCEKLSRVEVKLAAATDSLMSMQPRSGPGERAALMSEAAALLQAVSREIRSQQIHLQETSADSGLPGQREVWRTGSRETDSSAAEPLEVSPLAAEAGKAEIVRLLCGIQVRVGHLDRLNDAALSLCRGWLSARPTPAIDYTSEGLWRFAEQHPDPWYVAAD